jgi:hypothetical protein
MSNGKKKRVPKLNITESGKSTRTKTKKHLDARIGWNTDGSRKIYERDFIASNQSLRNMKYGIKNNVKNSVNNPDKCNRIESINKYCYCCPTYPMENKSFDRKMERMHPQIIKDDHYTYSKLMHSLSDSGKHIKFIYNVCNNDSIHLGELTTMKKI